MRGLVATLALVVSIGGLLLVIAYGASDAFLNFQDDEVDLNDSLLLSSLAPAGWDASRLSGISFSDEFIAPCLQTPLLNGTSIDGRGAMQYVPPTDAAPGAQMLVLQTSAGNARAIMDDVGRDTENGCQRGITVGTIERATVDSGSIEDANRSVLVNYDQQVGDTARSHVVLILQRDDMVAHLSYETTDDPTFQASDLTQLGSSLAVQIADPPTTAELAAAGALDVPTAWERRATRVNEEAERILTASGRYPVVAGLAGLGGLIVLLYVAGARLSRDPNPLPESASMAAGYSLPMSIQTVDDYGVPERRWIQNSGGRHRPQHTENRVEFDLDVPESEVETVEEEEDPVPPGPPPVIDFPQQSIEEKLKILKDARLKEPKREHRAMREVKPNVDWTEEISKSGSDSSGQPATPAPQPASRKAVMRKLRSNADSE